MSTENNTGNLRAWLRTCPAVAQNRRFGADYLGDGINEYAVMSVPSVLAYRENILGKNVLRPVQVQNFILASKDAYSADVQQNLANLKFYQDVSAWILQQNDAQTFPAWEGGEIRSIVPTITGAPIQTGANVARYQIQIRVTWRVTQ